MIVCPHSAVIRHTLMNKKPLILVETLVVHTVFDRSMNHAVD